jgi:hypothetical protein
MMSQRSKRELLEAIRPRYLKANKSEKTRMLDEYFATTEYHRKYANQLLKNGPGPKGRKKKGRRKVYQGEVVQALKKYGRSVDVSARNGCTPSYQRSSQC